MSTSLATRRLLLLSRAAPLRRTAARVLPRASLALRDGELGAARPFTVYALMRAAAAAATAKKTAPSKSKTAAAKKKTAAAKKKPAAKPKPKAKKPKAKTAVKKKKAVKKVVKKKTRQPLTEEQKEKRELLKLKKMALLKGPAKRPYSAWTVYVNEHVRKGENIPLAEQMRSLGSSFKNLGESEKQTLENTAEANRADNKKALSTWIKSFPVEVIYTANLARRRLAKKLAKGRATLIHDDRLPHRAINAYSRFMQERFDKQPGVSSTETFKELSVQWKALSDQEKAPYQQRASAEAEKSSVVLKELKQKGAAYWKEQAQAAV